MKLVEISQHLQIQTCVDTVRGQQPPLYHAFLIRHIPTPEIARRRTDMQGRISFELRRRL
jgi:hypothetical protein